MTQRTRSLGERFWSKVEINTEDECWLWVGGKSASGYGIFRPDRVSRRAHRVAYELLVGPIPDGMALDHLCRVRACVNPAHLEPVTFAENTRRWTSKITHCPEGHEYTPENTATWGGSRTCKECNRAHALRYYHRQKAKDRAAML